jgi:hypothetical protein
MAHRTQGNTDACLFILKDTDEEVHRVSKVWQVGRGLRIFHALSGIPASKHLHKFNNPMGNLSKSVD